MSRIGKNILKLPESVTVDIQKTAVMVKGPKGALTCVTHPFTTVEKTDEGIVVRVKDPEDKFHRALWGTTASNIANCVTGVSEGFSKELEVNGVGYKAESKGKKLVLQLGFSHPIEYDLPEGIEASVAGNVITIKGIDKQLVGSVAAKLRSFRKPEPYKGKGVKYVTEHIRRKAGKVVKTGE